MRGGRSVGAASPWDRGTPSRPRRLFNHNKVIADSIYINNNTYYSRQLFPDSSDRRPVLIGSSASASSDRPRSSFLHRSRASSDRPQVPTIRGRFSYSDYARNIFFIFFRKRVDSMSDLCYHSTVADRSDLSSDGRIKALCIRSN